VKETKLFCPNCGRCLGECSSSDDESIEKVLTQKPKVIKKKQMIHQMKCVKCKSKLYISMEFIN